jgi:hypothetical protein
MSKFQKYFTNLGIDVQKVLELDEFSGCSYVGQFPGGRRKDNGSIDFRDSAVDVFYQPNPDRSLGHTNYFSVFNHQGSVYIANAEYVTDVLLNGIIDSEGDILYARYQHDFRYTFDKKCGVDGGWWLKWEDGLWAMAARTIGSVDGSLPKWVNIRVKDGILSEV